MRDFWLVLRFWWAVEILVERGFVLCQLSVVRRTELGVAIRIQRERREQRVQRVQRERYFLRELRVLRSKENEESKEDICPSFCCEQ